MDNEILALRQENEMLRNALNTIATELICKDVVDGYYLIGTKHDSWEIMSMHINKMLSTLGLPVYFQIEKDNGRVILTMRKSGIRINLYK